VFSSVSKVYAELWARRSKTSGSKTLPKSLLKNSRSSSCGGADALTSFRLHYRSLRICAVGGPSHHKRHARNLNSPNFSTGS
jgi:hypothetical protein